MKKILIFTGTRAEFGLLKPLIDLLSDSIDFDVSILVSGMHLSQEFGYTFREFSNLGYKTEPVEILMSSDTDVGVSKAMGLGLISYSEVYKRLQPDMLLGLGDRFELFAAVSAAHVCRIPVIHLHGGEKSEGAIDEGFRHAITKLSQLHFTSTEEYKNRVIQLGEQPDRVFCVGAIGLDNIRQLNLLSREELSRELNFDLSKGFGLVTYHPVTLDLSSCQKQVENLFASLKRTDELNYLFTLPNADHDGRFIADEIKKFVESNSEKCRCFTSLGQVKYLSALKHAKVVIGNSSSGIIEAPSLFVPTVNIGDRQRGRVRAGSVIDCAPEVNSISEALNKACSKEFRLLCKTIVNPYYFGGNVARKIVELINENFHIIKKFKKFYDMF